MDAVWSAIEVHQPDAVMPLLKTWVALQPDASAAYEMLGWAYLVLGETELAAGNMRRALALDPGNERAEGWLRRLSR